MQAQLVHEDTAAGAGLGGWGLSGHDEKYGQDRRRRQGGAKQAPDPKQAAMTAIFPFDGRRRGVYRAFLLCVLCKAARLAPV
ncbi:hypothetical protein D3C72_1742340 [compost metagenome]